MKNSHRGLVAPLLLIIIAVLLAGGGYFYAKNQTPMASTKSDTEATSTAKTPATKPSVTLGSPNGGERWAVGSTYEIRWESNFTGGAIGLTLVDDSYNAGTEDNRTHYLLAKMADNTGRFSWTIPESLGGQVIRPGNKFKIQIAGAFPNERDGILDYSLVKSDESADYFTISNKLVLPQAPTITLLSPNGGERVSFGSTYQIKWQGKNLPSDAYVTARLESSLASSYFIGLAKASEGMLLWRVSKTVSAGAMAPITTIDGGNGYKIKLELYNSGNCLNSDACQVEWPKRLTSDTSDEVFTIINAVVDCSSTEHSCLCATGNYCTFRGAACPNPTAACPVSSAI